MGRRTDNTDYLSCAGNKHGSLVTKSLRQWANQNSTQELSNKSETILLSIKIQ